MAKKRAYRRRSEEERIAELEQKIASIKHKMELRERQDLPVLREIPKIQRSLRRFADLAKEHGRDDLYNSADSFVSGLDRVLDGQEMPRRRGRPPRKS